MNMFDSNYRNSLQRHVFASEEAFDKKIFAVSTGGLTLLFGAASLNKHLQTNVWFFLASACFCMSLAINIYSHLITSQMSRRLLENESSSNIFSNDQQSIKTEVKTKNSNIANVNNINFFDCHNRNNILICIYLHTIMNKDKNEREGFSIPTPPPSPDPNKQ